MDRHGSADRSRKGAGQVEQGEIGGEVESAEHRIAGITVDQARGLKDFGQAGGDGFRAGGQVHDAPILDLRPPLPVRQLVIEAAGSRAVESERCPRVSKTHRPRSTAGPS